MNSDASFRGHEREQGQACAATVLKIMPQLRAANLKSSGQCHEILKDVSRIRSAPERDQGLRQLDSGLRQLSPYDASNPVESSGIVGKNVPFNLGIDALHGLNAPKRSPFQWFQPFHQEESIPNVSAVSIVPTVQYGNTPITF